MAGRGIPLIIPLPLDPLRQDIRNVLHPDAGELFVEPALDLDHAGTLPRPDMECRRASPVAEHQRADRPAVPGHSGRGVHDPATSAMVHESE